LPGLLESPLQGQGFALLGQEVVPQLLPLVFEGTGRLLKGLGPLLDTPLQLLLEVAHLEGHLDVLGAQLFELPAQPLVFAPQFGIELDQTAVQVLVFLT